MKEYNNLVKDIKNKKFLPIYFLEGEEPFYIDKISNLLEENVLNEDEKAFNQNIIYGTESDLDQIISLSKQFPMGAERQLLIIKEAKGLAFDKSEAFANYVKKPQPSTILAINFKYKSLDKRKSLTKLLTKQGYIFSSEKLYDNQVPAWIGSLCQSLGLEIDEKSKALLSEFLGTDLSRIDNEIHKLKLIIGEAKKITPEIIERNIGISKEYNNFELRKAIVEKNSTQAYKIVDYFEKNPKANPIVVTFGTLISLFSNILIVHTLSIKTPQNIAKELRINPFFANEYLTAIKNYSLKKTTACIAYLRDADMKSKGVNVSSLATNKDILMEMLYKILH
ncbi:DNA polymerase III subunit delta [Apibacter adventoris]|uniref:DNA polymerase III subunit delta n=1 Tax=Apibacter adventoris TaxID=1679466 RepID=A0A2S8AGC4_9FLAO|nr:DNA polymerase III subunit delta [Apibacter adventoris]PQL95431.1 DNA polymerase III subunit delta [Apibacter adventoris]